MRAMRRRTVTSAVAIALLITATAVPASVASTPAGASDATKPFLRIYPAKRGESVYQLQGLRFPPHQRFVVSSDVFHFRGHRSETFRANGQGRLLINGFTPRTIPLSTTSGYVRIRSAATGTLITSRTVKVLPPQIGIDGGLLVCPGVDVQTQALYFPLGTYRLRSPAMTFDPAVLHVHAVRGPVIISARLRKGYAQSHFPVNIVPQGDAGATVTARASVRKPRVLGTRGHTRQSLTGTCFNPGQEVTVTPASAGVRGAPTAGPLGNVHFAVRPHAQPNPHVLQIQVTSEPSGRSTSFGLTVAGTTLAAGTPLLRRYVSNDHIEQLRSPDYSYRVATFRRGCRLGVRQINVTNDGTSTPRTVWSAGYRSKVSAYGTCVLRIGPAGNATLTSNRRGVVWQSHTVGTGHHNRLVLRDSGRLQLITTDGTVVWRSPADPDGG